jgi:hypothetical protein
LLQVVIEEHRMLKRIEELKVFDLFWKCTFIITWFTFSLEINNTGCYVLYKQDLADTDLNRKIATHTEEHRLLYVND